MPIEHRKFESLDRTFRNNIEHINSEPYIFESIENEKMKHDFDFCNNMLDSI